MFEQLEELIKTDSKSQSKFIKLKNEFYDNKKIMDARLLTLARRRAVVIGLVGLIPFIIYLFADVKKTQFEVRISKLENKIEQLETELSDCQLK